MPLGKIKNSGHSNALQIISRSIAVIAENKNMFFYYWMKYLTS